MDEQQTSREDELQQQFSELAADIKILKKLQSESSTESLERTLASLEHMVGEVKAEYFSLTGKKLAE